MENDQLIVVTEKALACQDRIDRCKAVKLRADAAWGRADADVKEAIAAAKEAGLAVPTTVQDIVSYVRRQAAIAAANVAVTAKKRVAAELMVAVAEAFAELAEAEKAVEAVKEELEDAIAQHRISTMFSNAGFTGSAGDVSGTKPVIHKINLDDLLQQGFVTEEPGVSGDELGDSLRDIYRRGPRR
jgi:hypothetical protein